MTHNQKLDKILMGLLSRMPNRLINGSDDKRLTFDFLCNALFEEEHEVWETKFLEKRLIEDGYVSFVKYDSLKLPDITSRGISFIQNGGYQKEQKNKYVEEELKVQSLKNAKLSWISLVIAALALICTILSFAVK